MTRQQRLQTPDAVSCLSIMARHGVPEHVVRHCRAVCVVALYLTRRLEKHGYQLDADMVRAAALLHDITKMHSLNRPLDHALTGAKLLKNLGYPEVAGIVRQHVRLSRSRPSGRISEAEIVNYSDKRVVNDQVTTLGDRLTYIRERYGRTPEALAWIEKFAGMAFALEKEIFDALPGGPEDVMTIDLQKELLDI